LKQLFQSLFFLVILSVNAQENAIAKKKSTASKQVSTFVLHSPQLKCDRKIWVYLPINYKGSDKRYPVLYMHDGQNLFDAKTSYAGEWSIDETLDSIHANIIVIGIENGGEKRMEELTPYINQKYGGGKANEYLDFIVSTLKQKIDSTYRTKTSAKNTAIMGSSLGGLVSFYAALKYPTVFGKVGCFSPSFWFNRKELFHLMEQTKEFSTRIYFLCGDHEGDEDMIPDMEKVEHWVNTKRCECKKKNKKTIVKNGQHNEKLWRENFKKAYLWLF